MISNIGFTGTREGLTNEQARALRELVLPYLGKVVTAHHGDCVGADKAFHDLIRMYAPPGSRIIGHLPADESHRAFCLFDETRPPLTHMKRNKAIVDASDMVFATPLQMEEQEYGGTWRTICMTRKARKPLTIVFPDGSTQVETA